MKINKITVITVCYNAVDTIEKTINSVLSQTGCNIEYLIQDGKSTDDTFEIIKRILDNNKNQDDCDNSENNFNSHAGSGIEIKPVSETDSGLYDAMNKAVLRATGDYVLFLNSGDVFCDERALCDISEHLDGSSDIVMGNVIRITSEGRRKETYGTRQRVFRMLLSGRMPCHQVIFAKRHLLLDMPFDLKYTICADFDFMVRCVRYKKSMLYINRDVSIVDCIEGISSQAENLEMMRRQDDLSLKTHFPFWYQLLRPVKYLKRKIIG